MPLSEPEFSELKNEQNNTMWHNNPIRYIANDTGVGAGFACLIFRTDRIVY